MVRPGSMRGGDTLWQQKLQLRIGKDCDGRCCLDAWLAEGPWPLVGAGIGLAAHRLAGAGRDWVHRPRRDTAAWKRRL